MGVPITLPKVSPQPHTQLAFEGYQYAKDYGKGNDYNHRVLEAFFVEGKDTGQIDVLTRLAGEVGLNEKEFEEALRTPQVPGGAPAGAAARLRGGRCHRRPDVRDWRAGVERLAGP
jgi:2-hydroxychromene-2-carboxylate isomerase